MRCAGAAHSRMDKMKTRKALVAILAFCAATIFGDAARAANLPRLTLSNSSGVLANANVVLVFWGDPAAPAQGQFWASSPAHMQVGEQFFAEFLHGYNVDFLLQYGVGVPQIAWAGTLVESYPPNSNTGLADILVAGMNAGVVPAPNTWPNMMYVYVIDPTSTHASFSNGQHDVGSWNGIPFAYGFAPFGASPAPSQTAIQWWQAQSNYTAAISHEVYEMLTDPFGSGWQALNYPPGYTSEIGDICEDILSGSFLNPEQYGPWSIESYWSLVDAECILGFESAWTNLGRPPGGIEGTVAVAQNANGGAFNHQGAWEMFATTPSGDLWSYSSAIANPGHVTWRGANWQPLVRGAKLTGSVVAGKDLTLGLLEVVGVAEPTPGSQEVWHAYQTSPAGPWTSGLLGGPPNTTILGNVAVGQNAPNPAPNGYEALEVFVIGGDGLLHHIWQLGAWKGWSGWGSSLGAPWVGIAPPTRVGRGLPGVYAGPVVASNSDGRLEVFVLGNDGNIWHIWQTAPNGGWSAWYSLPFGKTLWLSGFPTVVPFPDLATIQQDRGSWRVGTEPNGSLELFVVATDGNVYHDWQVAPSGGWAGWQVLEPLGATPGVVFSGGLPSAIVGSSAQAQAFVVGSDGALWTAPQLPIFGGAWTLGAFQPWRFLGSPASTTLVQTQSPVIAQASGGLSAFAVGTDGNVWGISQTTALGPWGALKLGY
jgi:hypothetical protein